MRAPRRFRSSADLTLQGRLSLRIAFYWALCQIAFAITVFSACRLDGFSQSPAGSELAPWQIIRQGIVITSLLLPVALVDMLLFSNRFAGPLLRLRRGLKRVAQGDEVFPVRFRKRDQLQDLGRDFNIVLERMNKLTADVETARTARPFPPANSEALAPEAIVEESSQQLPAEPVA